MPSYELSGAAESDLETIAVYTVKTFGIEQALAYRDGLIRSFQFLVENPKSARLRHELTPPVRAHRFQSHLIFYDVLPGGGILILSCTATGSMRIRARGRSGTAFAVCWRRRQSPTRKNGRTVLPQHGMTSRHQSRRSPAPEDPVTALAASVPAS